MAVWLPSLVLFLAVSTVIGLLETHEEGFDVRQHLSTVTSYGVIKDAVDTAFVPSDIPRDCSPIHLNLVSRHGTRSPTKKRMKELENLAKHLQELIRDAEERKLSLDGVPDWLKGWSSPWKGKVKGGELIIKGEEEMYDLGIRIRERFPELFSEEYHPDVYSVKATQVPRAAASAVAFGIGLFSGRGTLGLGKHRSFAITSENRASDIMLRFHDCCENYKDFRKEQKPAVAKRKEPILDDITRALVKRYQFNFTRQDTSSLWFLCKQEASLLDITNQACALFSYEEIALLEWTDDVEMFILKGYGKPLNYRMGIPLLRDVLQSMEEAIKAREEKYPPGSYEKARLRFAHAETVVPFTCLLGLFLDGAEFEHVATEQPLPIPPKPPQRRNWRGGIVSPFSGNNMLVLYSCSDSSSKYFVQVIHNEHPIPMPGCNNTDFCPLEIFKENMASTHLDHDYDTICNAKPAKAVEEPKNGLLGALLRWFFPLPTESGGSHRDEF